MFDQIFLYRIVNDCFDFPLIEIINFYARSFSGRRRHLFFVPQARTFFYYNSIYLRITRFYNWHVSEIDLFNLSLAEFKRRVILYLSRC